MAKTLSRDDLQKRLISCKESMDQLYLLTSSIGPIIDKDSPYLKELDLQVDSLKHEFYVLQREIDWLKYGTFE